MVRLLAAVAVVLAGVASTSSYSGAQEIQSNNFTADGTVESTGAPVPNVPGATGSFVLGSITRSTGNVMQSSTNGKLTINVHNKTRFYKESTPGNYAKSTFEDVVVPGETVAVNGRYYRTDGGWVLFANYVFNPPNTPNPGAIANPKPTSNNDYLLRRHFYVSAKIVHSSAPLRGGGGIRHPLGFTLNTFTNYGCSTPMCHVERIVRAHGGNLVVMDLNTTYWQGGVNGYQKTENRAAVIRPGATATVVGRYTWDGFDWRFNATHVFSPTLPPILVSGGVLKTAVELAKVAPGTYDENTDTWVGTQWTGTATYFPAQPATGNVTLTLDWHFNALDNVWEYYGDWEIRQRNNASSLAGTISGTAPVDPIGTADGTMTVDQGTGSLAGFSGFGKLDASAVNFSPPDASEPPVAIDGDMTFEIYR